MILNMLRYGRPHGSKVELEFIRKYIDVIDDMNVDGFGNRHITIGDDPVTTLFSCHTDTVHKAGDMYPIMVDDNINVAFSGGEQILGADNSAGVYIMLKMIEREIPGLYVFHRAEELGGQGSSYFLDKMIPLFPDLKRAIAFDRRGTNEVISAQAGGTCCSDEFATALATELNKSGMSYKPSPLGSFTDTANYMYTIPECTNIGVGYEKEHTVNESLDLTHLDKLVQAVMEVDWHSLPTVRDPVKAYDDYENSYYSYIIVDGPFAGMESLDEPGFEGLLQFVKDHPEAVASYLEYEKVTAGALDDFYSDDWERYYN